MVVSYVIRIAAAAASTIPVRARILSRFINNYAFCSRPSLPNSDNLTADAKELIHRNLVRVLDSDVKSKLLPRPNNMAPSAPKNFPFIIEDTPGNPALALSMEINGNDIRAIVPPPYINQEIDADRESGFSVWLYVMLFNSIDPVQPFWELGVHACTDGITISTVSIDGTTHTLKSGSELHSALKSFVEIRGITSSNAAFMYKYMIWRTKRDRILVLDKLNSHHHLHKKSSVSLRYASSHVSQVSPDALNLVDDNFMHALNSEMTSLTPSRIQVPEIPEFFPFEIKDTIDKTTIELTREVDGEKIVVVVFPPCRGRRDLSTQCSERRSVNFDEPFIQLTIYISKENEETLQLVFLANADYIGHPEIFIGHNSAKISGMKKHEQEDYWKDFIQVRGIDGSIGGFLIEYMDRRFDRDYFGFLKKLSVFA